MFTLGLGLIVATLNTFYRDCGHLIAVVLQAWYFATPILFPIEPVRGSAQWRLRLNPAFYFIELFHDILYAGQWPRIGLVATAARDRGGEPGNRICHIQVSRRQDGLSTLTGGRAGRVRDLAAAARADRAERRLASVRQLRRQAILAQARRARPGAAPRGAGARRRSSGRLQPHQLQDRPGRARGDRRRQRGRQEHAAAAAGQDLSADIGHVSIRGSVAPLIEMGAGFNPELSGKDNIILNGAMLGFSRSQMLGMVDRIHEFTGLREFAEMPLKYYSSGMYMRLAFAIATEVDPDILLIDESLGVGDAAFKDKAKARLRGLFERTKAVVLVSHEMEALRELCTRGLWIEHGQLVADGPIDEIIDRYLEAVAAQPHQSHRRRECRTNEPGPKVAFRSAKVRLFSASGNERISPLTPEYRRRIRCRRTVQQPIRH